MDLSIEHPDIGKKEGVPCKYLTSSGDCRIYHEGRPSLCRRYRCLWHMGGMPEGFRPDECGVLYGLNPDWEVYRVAGESQVILAYEIREGALDLEGNKKAIELLSKVRVVYCSSMLGSRVEIFGPNGLGDKVLEYFQTKARYLRSPKLVAMEAVEVLGEEDWQWFV